MPPSISAADERLLAAYQEAALRIQRTLQELNPRNRRIVLQRIDSILSELENLSASHIQDALPAHFRSGSEEAIRELKKLKGFGDQIDETFGTIHTDALNALAQDASLKFASTLKSVQQSARTLVTSSMKQQIIGKLLVAEIEGSSNPAQTVKDFFADQGVTALQGRKRNYTLEEYSGLVTHNILADAHNLGAATRYTVNGIEYARRIERADCCKICQPLRDKIIWLGDPRLLPPSHPWCYGGIAPVLGKPDQPIMSADDPRIPAKTREFLLKKA
jgi:hypothetical protein